MTMRISLLPVFVLFCFAAYAQEKDPKNYATLVDAKMLKNHLSILAADDMEGRETGMPGQKKAAAYIASQFQRIALQHAPQTNGYEQFYPLFLDSFIHCSLSVGENKLVYGVDFMMSVSQNESRNFNAKEIAFMGYGIADSAYDDYKETDVSGKVVLIFTGEPQSENRYFIQPTGRPSRWSTSPAKKIETAFQKGAVAVFMVNPAQSAFGANAVLNRTAVSNPASKSIEKKIAQVSISHALAEKIIGKPFDSLLLIAKKKLLFSNPSTKLHLPVTGSFEKKRSNINASNVVGMVEGTDKKDEYIFLTAHYDHLGVRDGKVYNGADDDGSGTVALIAMANAFQNAKVKGEGPRRTVVFMAFSGEEKGLWGSEYFSENPFVPLDKISVNLNTDMIGRVDTERKSEDTLNYIYIVGHDKISSDLPLVSEEVNRRYTGLNFDYKFDNPEDPYRIYFRSDHYHFARKGVPVLFFYDGMLSADYHQPTDDIEHINWPLFEQRARLIFHTAWEMANRNEMLIRDKPVPTATR